MTIKSCSISTRRLASATRNQPVPADGFLTRNDLVRRKERRSERRRKERKMLAAVDDALPLLLTGVTMALGVTGSTGCWRV